VVRIREAKREILPSLLYHFLSPLVSIVFGYPIKFFISIFKDFWDKRTTGVY